MENIEYVNIVTNELLNRKANNIKVIDIREKAVFADYFILATADSDRQVESLVDYVDDKMAQVEQFAKSIEGRQTGWILMDFGDIIVCLFNKEMREKYNLEKVWGDCPISDIE